MPMRGLQFRYCAVSLVTAVAVTVMGTWKNARAADPPTLLEQLSAQTQQVYQQVRVGIVRVEVPSPPWLQQINAQQRLFNAAQQQAGLAVENPNKQLALFVVGLVVDGDGHVMLPMYVDPQVVGDGLMTVRLMDGTVVKAKLTGSDKPTNMSVVQLQDHIGKQPVKLAHQRPLDGSLTVVISADGGARLSVWNDLHPDSGLIVMPDSSIAGFGSNGQFLPAIRVEPVIDQIIAIGRVRRGVLGLGVHAVSKDDPLRQETPQLADRPALLIVTVDADKAADRAGVRAGDLILSIGGENVGDSLTLAAAIANHSGKTDLQVLRGADVVTLSVDLQPK
jgi:hypothetical protein